MNKINDEGPTFPVCSVCGAQATIRHGTREEQMSRLCKQSHE
jgi:hypothetical protein